MMGHRAIYHEGWRAVCPWPGPSFAEAGKGFGEPIDAHTLADLDAKGWELYHVAEDFAENHDVAAENREQLIALIGTWYAEAGKYEVLPIDGSGLARFALEKPSVAAPRDSMSYFPHTQSVPFFAAPRALNRPHSITAHVEVPEGGAEGVLLAQGTSAGGFAFYVKDGRLHYVHNWVGRELLRVSSDAEVTPGSHELRYEFEPHGQPEVSVGHGMPGNFQLYIDGKLVGDNDVPYTTLFAFNPGALTCGADPGSPVTDEYEAPFRFTGALHKVTVDLSGKLITDPEAELKLHMARQ
jgi:arylsulfatase